MNEHYQQQLLMKTKWIKVEDALPQIYDVIGLQVSKNVLVYANREYFCVATLWQEDFKDVWRDSDGTITQVTHWQYIEGPNE